MSDKRKIAETCHTKTATAFFRFTAERFVLYQILRSNRGNSVRVDCVTKDWKVPSLNCKIVLQANIYNLGKCTCLWTRMWVKGAQKVVHRNLSIQPYVAKQCRKGFDSLKLHVKIIHRGRSHFLSVTSELMRNMVKITNLLKKKNWSCRF